jgi:hypothetical protein
LPFNPQDERERSYTEQRSALEDEIDQLSNYVLRLQGAGGDLTEYSKWASRLVELQNDFYSWPVEESKPDPYAVEVFGRTIELLDIGSLNDLPAQPWTIPGVLPEGGEALIYSTTGEGKSLLALDWACGLAVEGTSVLYVDNEMDRFQYRDRMASLGYDQSALGSLSYAQTQQLPPIDTEDGARFLLGIVDKTEPAVVILDTLIRVIEGDEMDSNTYARAYGLFGVPLKQRGITLLMLDHAGKDVSKGPRGSSAKLDMLELGWWLKRSGDKVTLTCKKSRMNGINEGDKVVYHLQDNPLRHVLAVEKVEVTPEIEDLIARLDELAVPLNATTREAATTLNRRRDAVLSNAMKARRIK